MSFTLACSYPMKQSISHMNFNSAHSESDEGILLLSYFKFSDAS